MARYLRRCIDVGKYTLIGENISRRRGRGWRWKRKYDFDNLIQRILR
jgi:hypothetical protein